MKYIATNIKVLRQEARLSFEDLSEITEISVDRLKQIEKGKIIPTEEEVELLCKPLRIHYEDIIERDILSERNEAGRKMKKSEYRGNYNWYLGDRKVFWIYFSYMLVVIIGLVLISIMSKLLNLDIIYIFDNNGQLLPTTWLEAIITSYALVSYVSGISFIIWLGIKLRYRFQWWHIFWISFVLSLVPVVGAITMLPSLGYSFYRSIIKRGKN